MRKSPLIYAEISSKMLKCHFLLHASFSFLNFVELFTFFSSFSPASGLWVNLRREEDGYPWVWGNCQDAGYDTYATWWSATAPTAMNADTECAFLDSNFQMHPIDCDSGDAKKALCWRKTTTGYVFTLVRASCIT